MTAKDVTLVAGCVVALAACGVEYRPLTANDVSYYRVGGKGETFETPLVRLTTNETARQRFWARVAKAAKPEIYQFHFRHRKGDGYKIFPPVEEGKAQIDAWFAEGRDFKVCPEKIYAVTLEEENISWNGQIETQNALVRHLKERYGVRTYHWLTEPLMPTMALVGDGWVFDAYSIVAPDSFYAHCESFVLTGLPVVPCLWASGRFSGYHAGKDWLELTRFTLERFDICRSLGLPLQAFAVAGKTGSPMLWFGKAGNPGEQFYRETVRGYFEAARAGAESSWKKPVKRWRVNVSRQGKLKAAIDLKRFDLVRETNFDDVRNWKLTEDGLTLLGAYGALEWRLMPSGDVTGGEFVLRHSPGAKGTFGGVPLSPNGETRMPVGAFRERSVALVTEGAIALAGLSFEGRGVFNEDVIEPTMDDSDGHTDYQAKRTFAGDDAWRLASAKGRVAKRRLPQTLALPGCCGTLTVTGDVTAMKSYGGRVSLALSLDGVTTLTNAVTAASDGNQAIQAQCAIPTGARTAYCIWMLSVDNGAEAPGSPRVEVKSAHYRLKPLRP